MWDKIMNTFNIINNKKKKKKRKYYTDNTTKNWRQNKIMPRAPPNRMTSTETESLRVHFRVFQTARIPVPNKTK